MAITFSQPVFLWLLCALPLLWFLPRRLRDVRHGVLRTLVMLFVILAAARPIAMTEEPRPCHVFIADLGASTTAADLDAVRAMLPEVTSSIPSEAHSVLLVVGEEVAVDSLRGRFDEIERVSSRSDLTTALEAAELRIPAGQGGSVTVLSDGLTTRDDWSAVHARLQHGGIPIHVVPLEAMDMGARVTALDALGELRVGQTARMRFFVEGRSSAARVRLTMGNTVLAESEEFAFAGATPVVLEFEPEAAGFVSLTAEVMASDDVDEADDSQTRLFAVQDPLRVLALSQRRMGAAEKLDALIGEGFSVESNSELVAKLDEFDAVVLDDLPADALGRGLQQRLARAVTEDGLGLVVAGGLASFGPGGYHDTPIEDLLPVELVQKEEKKDPSTSLAIIIDTSGSMGGNRIRLAKEVTRLAIRRMLPHDKVGIVEFYGAKRWAAPLQSAANAIDIQRALNRLDAGGGTVLFPALEEAYYGLRNAQTRYKHVLLLTDGGVETGPYESMMRKMSRDGICVSTVLVGPGRHSDFLVQIADWGNGRYYNASDRFNLPEIMLKQPSTAKLPAYRRGTHMLRTRGGPGWWGPVDPTQAPPLAGYVETRRRDGAESLIETSKDEHPILASWLHGAGRVTAMTTEPTGAGTSPWKNWSGYGALLARVVSRTTRGDRMPYAWSIERRRHRVILRARQLRFDAAEPTASTWGEAPSSPRTLTFRRQTAVDWVAEVPWSPELPFFAEAKTGNASDGSFRLVSGVSDDVAPERQVHVGSRIDLPLLAETAGGQVVRLDRIAETLPPIGGASAPRSAKELWSLAFLAALIAYLAEIFVRRRERRRPDVPGVVENRA